MRNSIRRGPGLLAGRFALATVLLIGAAQAIAQNAGTFNYEYREKIDKSTSVAPLGEDLFGDQTNYENGSTSFSAVDVRAETNVKLPLQLGRNLQMAMDRGINTREDPVSDVFGFRWSTDVPFIKGDFLTKFGWTADAGNGSTGRCTSGNFGISGTHVYTRLVLAHNFFSGNDINIPGYGTERLLALKADGARPADGATYVGTTKSNWKVSCLSSVLNGPGEGFVVTLPDGAKYYFDWMATRSIGYIPFSYEDLQRTEYRLYASRAVDRFGGTVQYTYDPTNPHRITRIAASDGAAIDVAYNPQNGKISTVSTAGMTWQYVYRLGVIPSNRNYDELASVVLPDLSKWTYGSMPGGFSSNTGPQPCSFVAGTRTSDQAPGGSESTTFRIVHPSGAIGDFGFRAIMFGYNRTPDQCHAPIPSSTQPNIPYRPKAFIGNALYSKTISGPGVAPKTWTVKYYPSWSYGYECGSCATTAQTRVYESTGETTTYTFGNDYTTNAGQLLSKSTTGVGVNYLETYQYLTTATGQPFPDSIGEDKFQINNNPFLLKNRPLLLKRITQDGATFTMQVTGFDAFARPINVVKFSGGMTTNYTRTDSTTFYDHLNKWVLGQVAKSTNLNSGLVESELTYDPATAMPVQSSRFGKLLQTLTYNADGTIATKKDGNNNITTFSAWKRGVPQIIRYAVTPESPAGAVRSAQVNDNGWILNVTDESGSKTCYQYDAMGRVKLITYPSETQAGVCDGSAWSPTSISFVEGNPAAYGMPAGHWRQTTLTGNSRKILIFDALWRPVVEQTLDLGNSSATTSEIINRYDADGRLAFKSYPMNTLGQAVYTDLNLRGTSTAYDVLGRITSVQAESELTTAGNPRGYLTTRTEYLTGFKTRVTNPRGQQTTTSYMAYDEPTFDMAVTALEPEGKQTTITRDLFGKPTALARGGGGLFVTRQYKYDSNQQLCKVIEPEIGATFYDYDGYGNVAWTAAGLAAPNPNLCERTIAYSSGRRVQRIYDARNRLSQLVFPDGRGNQAWSYTSDGLTAQITTWNNTNNTAPVVNSYLYNKRRLLSGETTEQPGWYSWAFSYGYDANANMASQSYPTGLIVRYAPNALGQATSVVDNQGGTYASNVSYYPNGAIKQFTYGNGLTHVMTQSIRQLPARISDSAVQDMTYAYDANGNLTTIRDVNAALYAYSGNRDLMYDGLDRLTQAHLHWWQIYDYTYDALDNISRRTMSNGAATEVRDYVYESGTNRLVNIKDAAGATTIGFDYDVQGNIKNKNGFLYQFDYGNRLRSNSFEQGFMYDGHGRRASVTRGTMNPRFRKFAYSSEGQLLHEENTATNGTSDHIYFGGRLLASRSTVSTIPNGQPTISYAHIDVLGSPVARTSVTGALLDRTNFEPYGAAINKPTYEGIGYAGHVQDSASGLTYMQQRFYDGDIGRFMSVDPVDAGSGTGANFNRYWYANNSPYNFTDPDGRYTCEPSICGAVRSYVRAMGTARDTYNRGTPQWKMVNAVLKAIGPAGSGGPHYVSATLTRNRVASTDQKGTTKLDMNKINAASDPVREGARALGHEGQHDIDSAVNGVAETEDTVRASEENAYTTESVVAKGLGEILSPASLQNAIDTSVEYWKERQETKKPEEEQTGDQR